MFCEFKCGKEYDSTLALKNHQCRCPSNPNRIKWKIKDLDAFSKLMKDVATAAWTPEARENLSESMKLAHKEGRAWNIGMNRWKKQPSYPEQFFAKVIENEFDDKTFEREVWFHGFVLDFLWRHKKLVIEMDGKQHDTPEQKARDQKKDALLIDAGYQVLRIKWSEMSRDPKHWIAVANKFIGVMA